MSQEAQLGVRIVEAGAEHDAAVEALFRRIKRPLRTEYWERAWGDRCPPAAASTPLVALDSEGDALAFAAARPARIHAGGEDWDAVVIHEAAAEFPAAASAVLERAADQAPVAIVGGLGPATDEPLADAGFHPVGHFARWAVGREGRFPRHETLALNLEPAFDLPSIEALAEADPVWARGVHRHRPVEERTWLLHTSIPGVEVYTATIDNEVRAYAAVREENGPAGPELHLIDAWAPSGEGDAFAEALARLALERRRPLYVGLLAEYWAGALAEAGFELLQPGWLLWVRHRDDDQTLLNALLRRETWFFTPVDAELDGW